MGKAPNEDHSMVMINPDMVVKKVGNLVANKKIKPIVTCSDVILKFRDLKTKAKNYI
jgi:hypothetical protein